MLPKISVIMSVFDQDVFLKDAIKSILNQTYTNLELLIVDDCSTDNSFKIINSFNDARIKIYQNKKRIGLSKNLNFLINKSKGKYIARMDGDDISEENRLEEQVKFLNNDNQLCLVGCWSKIIDSKNNEIGRLCYPVESSNIREVILSYNPFVHPSIMFRKDTLIKLGGYDEQLILSQDYDLFLRLVIKYRCSNMPKFLFKFRWHPDFAKQKKQHFVALKLRFKAFFSYGYPISESYKIIKPILLYFIPSLFKSYYWRFRLK